MNLLHLLDGAPKMMKRKIKNLRKWRTVRRGKAT